MTSGRPILREELALVLRAALHPDLGVARGAWERWREGADLRELDPGVLRIAGLVADRLEALGARDDEAARLILWRVRFTWLRSVTMRKRTAPVLAALHERGIRALLMKGPAVLHHVGGPQSWRPMEDLDLLVDPENVAVAADVLREHGFASEFDPGLAAAPEAFAPLHAVPFDDGEGGEIDLHRRGAHTPRDPAIERRRFEGAVAGDVLGAPVLFPRAEEVLVQAVEHGTMLDPLPAGTWAADIALLLRDGPALDWELVADLSRDRRLGTLVPEAMEIACEATGIERPAAAPLERLRPTLAQLARRRRSAAARPAPPTRVGRALEALEEHASLRGARRARPSDAVATLARTWHLPSAATAPRYALHAALGHRRALRDVCAPPRGVNGAEPLALSVHLDLSSDGDPSGWQHLRSGWSAPEPSGAWILGEHGLLVLPLDLPPGTPLRLVVGAGTFLLPPEAPSVGVRVLVDDVAVGRLRFDEATPTATTELDVPAGVVRGGGAVSVGFVPERSVSPAQLGLSADPRRLSAYVRHVMLHSNLPSE